MRTGRVFNRKGLKFDDGILKEHNEGVCTTIVDAYKSGENRVWIQHASGAGKSYIATKIIKNLADNKFDRIGRLGKRRLLSDYSARDQKRVLFVTSRKYLRTDFEDLNDNVKDRFRKLGRKIELTTETYYGLNKHLEEEYDMIIFDEMHHLGAKVWGAVAEQVVKNNPTAQVLGLTATPNRSDGVDITEKIFGGKGPVSKLTADEAVVKSILPSPYYVLAQYIFEGETKALEEDRKELKFRLETAVGEEKKQIENLIKQLEEAQEQIDKAKNLPQIFAEVFNTESLRNGKYIVFCPKGKGDDEQEAESEESLTIMEHYINEAKEKWFKDLPGFSNPKIYKVHSKYDDAHNIKDLKDFENDKSNGIKLMFSVDMLGEGKHVDDIDGVIMLRPTGSEIVFMQQLARALSVGNNSHPLILDLVGNLTYSNYEITQKIISEINERKKEYECTHKPKFYTPNFELKTINLSTVEFVEKFKKAFDRNFDNQEVLMQELRKYYAIHGDLQVPYYYDKDPNNKYPLYSRLIWQIRVERGTASGRKLSQEHFEELNKMDENWLEKRRNFDFDKFFKHCEEYYDIYRSLWIPSRYPRTYKERRELSDPLYNLGVQMDQFKRYYKKMQNTKTEEERQKLKKSTSYIVSEEDYEKLFKLDPDWAVNRNEFNFEKLYKHCKEYHSIYGNLKVPQKYPRNAKEKAELSDPLYNLGKQMSNFRGKYRDYRNARTEEERQEIAKSSFIVSDEEYQKLVNLDPDWAVNRNEFNFEKFYKHCKEYHSIYGDLKIHGKYPRNAKEKAELSDPEYNLGIQMSSFKGKYRDYRNARTEEERQEIAKSSLIVSDEEYQKLFNLDPDWAVNRHEFDFEKFYKHCEEYHSIYGNLKIPAKYPRNAKEKAELSDPLYNLGKQMSNFRGKYREYQEAQTEEEKLEIAKRTSVIVSPEDYAKLFKLDITWADERQGGRKKSKTPAPEDRMQM